MATVTVRTAAGKTPTRRRVVLRAGTRRLTLPITNPEVPIDLGGKWTTITRPGLDDLLRYGGAKPYVISLDVTLYNLAGITVRAMIQTLRDMSQSNTPVSVAYGSTETGTYRITGLKPKVTQRHEDNNAREGAVTIELTRIGNERITLPSRAAPAKPAAKKGTSSKKRVVHYTVKRGDTLTKIAGKVCHNTGHWQRIARDNNIRDPRKIHAGQKLTITCL